MVSAWSSEKAMPVPKKQSVTVALDPPDLERVKRVAERERGTPSGVIRRLVAEGFNCPDNAPFTDSGIGGMRKTPTKIRTAVASSNH